MKIISSTSQNSYFQMPWSSESALYRNIRSVFTKMVDLWASADSYFCQVELSQNYTAENTQNRPNASAVVPALIRERAVGSSSIETYMDVLEGKNNAFQGHISCTVANGGSSLPNKKQETTLLAIPVVLKGAIENHIVTFLVDFTNKRIEFYDSKGLPIEDQAEKKLLSADNVTLSLFLTKIKSKYGAFEVVQNVEKHQYDCHNCGIYVYDYLKQRSEGTKMEEIKGKNFEEINKVREEIIQSFATPAGPRNDTFSFSTIYKTSKLFFEVAVLALL